MAGSSVVVMGVCASGKTTIGEHLAKKLGRKFIDGDDLHPRANIQKMASGQPLNDDDRKPWLERIRDAAYSLESKNEHGIIVCSALKKIYRDQIREGNENVSFLFLDGSKELILERMRARQGHFMKENMVNSQFETLERPEDEPRTIFVSIDATIEEVVSNAAELILVQDEAMA
ncbi:D-gluconate kinase, thermosensitive [Vibrio rotiferianus]|jgi:gluconokinase|uniref:Gluconokinase n=1 Tax=Vibrio rotiferianus TaxID=190895 RepID=A0ABX3D5Q8_9VIBR|nr:gluconokinase [Vibrio rotiferianus]OHY91320.1 gluconate kinase [Vibrio rotiferianus]CAH1528799.1 D-gluconate kinase, thermosensitive [Vibrio rotiferianus]CAH1567297.1 D-gluconate kinase, thermosensitive [Vibrio rotiferianus]CAH1569364.1 D-gluconate kinase, thermosensitive [Vibrio rotiferianus]